MTCAARSKRWGECRFCRTGFPQWCAGRGGPPSNELTLFQRQVLQKLASVAPTRLIPNEIGYALIEDGILVPTRSQVSAQGAARMVIKPLAKLEKLRLIDYQDPDTSRRGYTVTSEGKKIAQEVRHG